MGAILTQNTSWTQVEHAIANLKRAGVLAPQALWALQPNALAQLIRPSGSFHVKSHRLRAFLSVLVETFGGSLEALFQGPTPSVRERLLAIPGIGPETADSMLLYAGGHEIFVVDAYTRRVFLRHGWCGEDWTYDDLQQIWHVQRECPSGLARLDYWQDAHAQLVEVGKRYCRPAQARCEDCPLRPLLPREVPLVSGPEIAIPVRGKKPS